MRRFILISLALLLALGLSSLAITGCGGGGGGGSSAVYSVAGGLWQMTATNAPGAIVGARVAFRTNGTGYIDIYGIRVSITWSQDGNVVVIAVPGEGATAATLEWNGPNEFTIINSAGERSTYVRVGTVGVIMDRPENPVGGTRDVLKGTGL
jgi:hypothetical protein